jgi:hypothetical protein
MAIEEGIETTASYMQSSGIAGWAGMSTSGVRRRRPGCVSMAAWSKPPGPPRNTTTSTIQSERTYIMDMNRFALATHRTIILWGSDPERPRDERITEVLICNKDEQPTGADRLHSSRGSCDADWLNGDPCNSPLGIWAMMATIYGFASEAAKIEALREFTKIRGQDWAVWMLREVDPS